MHKNMCPPKIAQHPLKLSRRGEALRRAESARSAPLAPPTKQNQSHPCEPKVPKPDQRSSLWGGRRRKAPNPPKTGSPQKQGPGTFVNEVAYRTRTLLERLRYESPRDVTFQKLVKQLSSNLLKEPNCLQPRLLSTKHQGEPKGPIRPTRAGQL